MTMQDVIKNSGFKKKYIAEQLGISSPTLKRKLDGEKQFTGKELDKLCELFSMSYDDLLAILFVNELS